MEKAKSGPKKKIWKWKSAKVGQKRPLSVWTVDRDPLSSSLKSEYLARLAATVQKYELCAKDLAQLHTTLLSDL